MRRKILSLILILTWTLTGCVGDGTYRHQPSDEAGTSATVDPQGQEVSDGRLKLSMRTTQTLHPLYNEDESVAQILLLLYRPLIALDQSGKPSPSIAEQWDFDASGTVLTLQLRDDIVWQDGNQLSSVDVVYSVRELQNAPDHAVYKGCVEHIVSCSAPDSRTVRITFDEPYSGNLYAATFPVVERAAFTGLTEAEKIANLAAVGNGLYQLESYTPAKGLTLTRYDGCFLGRAQVETVAVEIVQDKETELYSFGQGLIDAVAATETDLGKFDVATDGQRAEFVMNYFDFIGFNFRRELFQDPLIRRAISSVVPREEILNNIYLNHAVAADVPVNPSSWLWAGTTGAAGTAGGAAGTAGTAGGTAGTTGGTTGTAGETTGTTGGTTGTAGETAGTTGGTTGTAGETAGTTDEAAGTTDGTAGTAGAAGTTAGTTDGTTGTAGETAGTAGETAGTTDGAGTISPIAGTVDREAAQRLLEQAGWDYDASSKLRYKNSDGAQPLRTTILVNSENEERRQTAIYLADELKYLGFDAQVEEVDFETYQSRLEAGDFDLYLGGWKMSVDPDLRFFLGAGGDGNYGGYESDRMEEALAAAANAVTETAIQEAYAALAGVLREEIPCITIAYRKAAVYSTEEVEGSLNPVESEVFRGIEHWKLK